MTPDQPMTAGERILAALPATGRDLRDQLGLSPSIFHKWMTRLREGGQARIGRWARTLGDYSPVYVKGKGKDAARPKRRTKAQLQAKYIQSLRDAGLYEDYLAEGRRRGAKWRAARGKKSYRPESFDPLLKSFFGQL